jgi:hypothetical protein
MFALEPTPSLGYSVSLMGRGLGMLIPTRYTALHIVALLSLSAIAGVVVLIGG